MDNPYYWNILLMNTILIPSIKIKIKKTPLVIPTEGVKAMIHKSNLLIQCSKRTMRIYLNIVLNSR